MSKDELYEKYKFLVYKVIKDLGCKYRNDDEFEEYLFWGNLGLIKAINGYDETKISSSAFFYTSIKNSIMTLFKKKNSYKRKINYTIMMSLDSPIKEDTEFHEIIPDEAINIEDDAIKKEEYEILYKAIDMLKPKYKEIICDYFGIRRKSKTLQQIANETGISRQAVNVKKDTALEKLKVIFKKLGGI